jgi:hypothetical protein
MTETSGIVTSQAKKTRPYSRRSDSERIADLQKKIEALQGRLEKKQRKDLPVLREVPKVQRHLRAFVQLALNHGRQDLATSAMAFAAGLERALEDVDLPRRRRAGSANEGHEDNGTADEAD